MRKLLSVAGFVFLSFLGGSVGHVVAVNALDVSKTAYRMLSVWTGQAGSSNSAPWPNSHYGFGGVKTSDPAVTPFASVSSVGGWGGYFATRTSDWKKEVGTYPSALNHLCVLDSNNVGIWCQYLQGEMLASSSHQLINAENSIRNTAKPLTNIDPFHMNAGNLNVNYRIDCGVGESGPPSTNCGAAIQILNNGAKYSNPPIIVGEDSIDTSLKPNPSAIAMPAAYGIGWYTSAGVLGGTIFSGTGSPDGVVSCAARCLYIRTDGGVGSTLYVNETGGGTAGWSAK